jgi:phage major head subunit gpT-like protein
MIVNSATLEALRTGFSLAFMEGYNETVPFADMIAGKVSSSTKSNTYGWLDVIPKMREWVGFRIYNNLIERAQVVVNKEYEESIEVKRTDIEDDNLNLFSQKSKLLARAGRKHPDYLVRDLLVAGTTTLCFDGQFLFDTDHPVNIDDASFGTQSNKFALALTAANFSTVIAAGKKMKGADGEPIGAFQNSKKIFLVVPPDLEATAKEIVAARTVPNGGENPNYGMAVVVCMPELTDATEWFLIDMNYGISAIMLQERLPLEQSEQTDPNSEAVFTANVFRYGLRWRGAAFTGLYWFGVRSKP